MQRSCVIWQAASRPVPSVPQAVCPTAWRDAATGESDGQTRWRKTRTETHWARPNTSWEAQGERNMVIRLDVIHPYSTWLSFVAHFLPNQTFVPNFMVQEKKNCTRTCTFYVYIWNELHIVTRLVLYLKWTTQLQDYFYIWNELHIVTKLLL